MLTQNISNISWNSIEYIIDNFDICIGKKTIPIHNAKIKNLYMEKDFDGLMLPIFIVKIAIPEDLYYDIHSKYKTTTFRIVMSSRKRLEDGKYSKKSVYMSDTFNVLGIDGTPFTNEKEYKKIKKASGDINGNTMQELANDHTFILGKRKMISNIKKIKNVVFTSATMTEATNYLFSSCGIKNVLMTPMDNTNSYKELVLLPIPLIQQLQYLNSMFGFYKYGAQIFFDFNRAYLLKNTAKCTVYQPNEIQSVVLVIYKKSNGKQSDKGSAIINHMGYINIGISDNLSIQNLAESNDSAIGNNTVILNDSGKYSTATGKSSGSYNVMTTTSHNAYHDSEVKARLKELEGIVNVALVAVDLSLLTPNKHFTIVSDDSKVTDKLKYPLRLSGYSVTFAREGSAFTPIITATFKKSEE